MEFNPLTTESLTDEEALRNYIVEKDVELENDTTQRIKGQRSAYAEDSYIFAGYTILREFFDGDQWHFPKESGGNQRVYNYCRTTVINYTSFLANEPPEFDVPPRDVNDELEIALAEEKEILLKDILKDNKFPIVFSDAVQNQSLLGDAMVFGPYIQVKNKLKRIRFQNIKRPENVRIFWSDHSYTEMDGFVYHWRISVASAKRIFAEEIEKEGIILPDASKQVSEDGTGPETNYPMVDILQYWDENYMMFLVNNKKLKYMEHNWGFVPLQYIKNVGHPTKAWGVSDIEDMLDAQVEYNESAGVVRDIIDQDAVPHIFTSGVGEAFAEYKAGRTQIVDLGDEGKVFPDPRRVATGPVEQYLAARKNDIHGLSMVSEVIYGGPRVREATGRALSILLQGINNKVKMKQVRWDVALKSLSANIFRLVEIYFPQAKKLIQGVYDVDVFFSSVMIRDVREEINKFNMKLQSQGTTMKNLGIPSPKEEQKKILGELENMSLAIELSRNPQMRMEMQRMIEASATRNGQEVNKPQLAESENQPEEAQPESAPGTPVMTERSEAPPPTGG